jgi:CMP-N,N'-diacetyllegionaminic acid synthase
MVSTDSEIYASIAKKWGAEVPFLRSREASNDTASSWSVVKEVLRNYGEMGITFDTVTLLQPTSPLREAEDIVNGYKILREKDANLVVAVCEVAHSPLWANTLPENNSLTRFLKPEVVTMPRQSIPKYYRINGALYIIRVDYLLKSKDIYKEKSFALIMDRSRSIDIDDELDFDIAEVLIKHKNKK